MNKENIEYWDDVYSKQVSEAPQYPSQFAAFAIGEMQPGVTIIECGCGNGRDAFFFNRYGWNVLGLDASTAIIERNKDFIKRFDAKKIDFESFDFGNSDGLISMATRIREKNEKIYIYSRFFLHAIGEESELNFLNFCKMVINPKEKIFLEFRTLKDVDRTKEAPRHFRRFISESNLLEKLKEIGFTIEYYAEGLGFAKRGTEDAHVARILAVKA